MSDFARQFMGNFGATESRGGRQEMWERAAGGLERNDVEVRTRMPRSLKNRVDAWANANRRDVSNAVRVLVEQAMDEIDTRARDESAGIVAPVAPVPPSVRPAASKPPTTRPKS